MLYAERTKTANKKNFVFFPFILLSRPPTQLKLAFRDVQTVREFEELFRYTIYYAHGIFGYKGMHTFTNGALEPRSEHVQNVCLFVVCLSSASNGKSCLQLADGLASIDRGTSATNRTVIVLSQVNELEKDESWLPAGFNLEEHSSGQDRDPGSAGPLSQLFHRGTGIWIEGRNFHFSSSRTWGQCSFSAVVGCVALKWSD